MKSRLLLLVAFLTFAVNAHAQKFVADGLGQDSISAYPVQVTAKDTIVNVAEKICFPNGDTLTYANGKVNSSMALMQRDGRYFAVGIGMVKYCGDNTLPNTIQDDDQIKYHSAIGHFYHSYAPYWIIFGLMIALTILMQVIRRAVSSYRLTVWLMFAVPLGLFLVSAMEAMAFVFTPDMFWWIDMENLGFWKTSFRALPLVLTLVLQFHIGIQYKRFLEGERKLSWRPIFITWAICIPCAVIAAILVASLHLRACTDVITALAFFGVLAVGFIWSLVKNVRTLGIMGGVLFSIFSFFYAIGALIAASILVVVLVKLLLQALVWLLVCIPLIGGRGKTGTNDMKSFGQRQTDAAEAQRKKSEERRHREWLAWQRGDGPRSTH